MGEAVAVDVATNDAISAVTQALQQKTHTADWQRTLESALASPSKNVRVGEILRDHGWSCSGRCFQGAIDCKSLQAKLHNLKSTQTESTGVNWIGRGFVCCIVLQCVKSQLVNLDIPDEDVLKVVGVSIVIAMMLFRTIVDLNVAILNLILRICRGLLKASILVAFVSVVWYYNDPAGMSDFVSNASIEIQSIAAGGFAPGMEVILQEKVVFEGGETVLPGVRAIVHAVPLIPEFLGGELVIITYATAGNDKIKFSMPASRLKVEKNPEVFCRNMRVTVERDIEFESGVILHKGDLGTVDFAYRSTLTVRADPVRGQKSFLFDSSPADVDEERDPETFTKGTRVLLRRRISFEGGGVLQEGHKAVVMETVRGKCETFQVKTEAVGGQKGMVFDANVGDVERDTTSSSLALVGDESIAEAAPILLDEALQGMGRFFGRAVSAFQDGFESQKADGDVDSSPFGAKAITHDRRTIKPDGTVVEERFKSLEVSFR